MKEKRSKLLETMERKLKLMSGALKKYGRSPPGPEQSLGYAGQSGF